MKKVDVIIIGAGAAGLMCAIESGKRQRHTLLLDHANKAGKKILMSGGGRCNFTNYYIQPACYISHNPHFCKSALSRYTQWDFIDLVNRYAIPYHEKTAGQLFCDNKSIDILNMLLEECKLARVPVRLNTRVLSIENLGERLFKITTDQDVFHCESVVIATGGLSIPTMGATPFAYHIATQFGLKVWPTRAALVPFTLTLAELEKFSALSGISVDSRVSYKNTEFRENILFTHRGLSGPAILQISSYWVPNDKVSIDLLPEINLLEHLFKLKQDQGSKLLKSVLSELLPKRVVETFLPLELAEKKLASLSNQELHWVNDLFHSWEVKPNGTEGYRTAEVTLGGIDCDAISSKTMETNSLPGLFFIGEALDVTGWLGGYNFQWAWSSGWVAGQVV